MPISEDWYDVDCLVDSEVSEDVIFHVWKMGQADVYMELKDFIKELQHEL